MKTENEIQMEKELRPFFKACAILFLVLLAAKLTVTFVEQACEENTRSQSTICGK